MDHFEELDKEIPTIKTISTGVGPNSFYAQEVLRFSSIAGTLLKNFDVDNPSSVEERYLSHILFRSLLENYFWIIYIFDDKSKKSNRYDSLLDSFRKEYLKLMNDPMVKIQTGLEPAQSSWSTIPRVMDVNSMLNQVKNDYGDRLSYLYFIYRISSFDTHGKNLSTVFESVFGKQVSFPVLKLKYAFDLISNQYLLILQELRCSGEI
ncbi:TPA: hypothetical protein ACSTLW_001933 [Serratia fonticola]